MTNPLQTIPNLPPALALDGSEQVWLNQAGADVRTTVAAIGTITAPFVYLPLIGGTLTGPLNINADLMVEGYIHTPTPPPSTHSDIVATTAFVANAVGGALGNFLPILGGTIQGNLAVTGTTTLNGATTLNGLTTATAAVDLTGAFPSGSGPNTGFALAVDVPAGAFINLNGSAAGIAGARGASRRWLMLLGNGTAESGGNAGSDFTIQNLSDAGASLGTALTITRATGAVSLGGALNVAGGTTLNGAAAFNGATTAITQPPGNNTTLLATTAFVEAAISGSTAGVSSWNGRTGAVTLTTADVNAAGGPYLPLTGGTLSGPGNLAVGGTLTTTGDMRVGAALPTGGGALYNEQLIANNVVSSLRLAFNSYVDSTGTWRALATGRSSIFSFDPPTGAFELYNNPSVAADAPVTLTGVMSIDAQGNITANKVTVNVDPTAPLDLVTLQYFQAHAGAGGIPEAPTDGQIYGREGSNTSWQPVLPLTGGAITGPVTAPTPATADNSTNIATTAYVRAGFLPLTGGTLTGILTVAGTAGVRLNKSAGANNNNLIGAVSGSPRWYVLLGDNTAETGSNAGSNFAINSYTDVGVLIGAQFSINRATGVANFTSIPTSPTPTAGDNSTNIATTAFVHNAVGTGGAFLPLTGGTLTGALNVTAPAAGIVVAPTASSAQINLNKPSGAYYAQLVGYTAASLRWALHVGDSGAESGSNAGSDFSLDAFADDGSTSLGRWFIISRANGGTSFLGTGGVNLSPPSVSAVLNLNKGSTSGQYNILRGSSNTSRRWELILGDSTAETGSNAGSNFSLNAFNDGGATALGQYMTINRANGNATFSAALNIGGWFTCAGITSTNNITAQNCSIYITAGAGQNTNLFMNKSANAQVNYIWGQNNGTGHWGLALGEGSAQTGGNTGDNFGIVALTDSGGWNDWAFYIFRSTMQCQINHGLVINGGCTVNSGIIANRGTGGSSYCVVGAFTSGTWWNAETLSVNVNAGSGNINYNNGSAFVVWSTTSSDRRLKSNLKPAGDALCCIKQIPVYDLDYNAGVKSDLKDMRGSETEHWAFSLIADEVAAVLPHATIRNEEDDGEHHVGLHPTHLVSVLWRAVQQLTGQNDALAARVAALEAKA